MFRATSIGNGTCKGFNAEFSRINKVNTDTDFSFAQKAFLTSLGILWSFLVQTLLIKPRFLTYPSQNAWKRGEQGPQDWGLPTLNW
jgi:hypothetical protein